MFFRALVLVQYAFCKKKKEESGDTKVIFSMKGRLYQDEISKYAAGYDVEIVWPKVTIFKSLMSIGLSWLKPSRVLWIKMTIKYVWYEIIIKGFKRMTSRERNIFCSLKSNHSSFEKNPRLAVEYYGFLNLDQPQRHSDLFFWQNSNLRGEDVIVTFNIARDPLDAEKIAQLKKHNIEPAVLNPKASCLPLHSAFYYWPPIGRDKLVFDTLNNAEKRFVQDQIAEYRIGYGYWRDFFQKNNIKIYVSWFKYTGQQCVIADALQSLGGVTAIYQRSFEETPFAGIAVSSDIVFAFSPNNAEVLLRSGSVLPYHVAVGYLGDFRFSLVRNRAQGIRAKLQKNGARHILAFFDENFCGDSRWSGGHNYIQTNYEFLLKKVISDDTLGLVIKPKVASTLRTRLGPIAQLLEKAVKTGRCFIFEGGKLHNSYPPAIAALASDIAIHAPLVAATAGMESALSGVPTLLLDHEDWPVSKLYSLGLGQVVFTDWDSLWRACKDYWGSKEGVPGFGDWSPLLDEMDPFRDGKAAERMGTYLKWILDGFKDGLGRDTILADAAHRYVKVWGKDKITGVK